MSYHGAVTYSTSSKTDLCPTSASGTRDRVTVTVPTSQAPSCSLALTAPIPLSSHCRSSSGQPQLDPQKKAIDPNPGQFCNDEVTGFWGCKEQTHSSGVGPGLSFSSATSLGRFCFTFQTSVASFLKWG